MDVVYKLEERFDLTREEAADYLDRFNEDLTAVAKKYPVTVSLGRLSRVLRMSMEDILRDVYELPLRYPARLIKCDPLEPVSTRRLLEVYEHRQTEPDYGF